MVMTAGRLHDGSAFAWQGGPGLHCAPGGPCAQLMVVPPDTRSCPVASRVVVCWSRGSDRIPDETNAPDDGSYCCTIVCGTSCGTIPWGQFISNGCGIGQPCGESGVWQNDWQPNASPPTSATRPEGTSVAVCPPAGWSIEPLRVKVSEAGS